ncbi:hypothetical protein ONV78_27040 [Hahella sp. CR1]|uniref:hypothetical protein n=1 Tax=Hahella sp. CR1 TaxID=2992807 RepID=UPI002441E0EF|nr:hypothetical protein [Hahella sp. CR1]MDG9671419.1 hypothetical protein [Hahella sp. CR1]
MINKQKHLILTFILLCFLSFLAGYYFSSSEINKSAYIEYGSDSFTRAFIEHTTLYSIQKKDDMKKLDLMLSNLILSDVMAINFTQIQTTSNGEAICSAINEIYKLNNISDALTTEIIKSLESCKK